MPRDPTGGPYLVNAFFCEKVLQEADGVLSFIRVVDKFMINGHAEQMPVTVLNVFLCITIRSGAFRGPGHVTITPISPSGNQLPSASFPVQMEGDDDRGSHIMVQMGFPVSEHGAYWFDIAFNQRPLTYIAIRVTYSWQPTMQPPQPEQQG